MISADIKTDLKQQEIKYLVAVSTSQLFTEVSSQNLKYIQSKVGMYLSFNLGWYSIQLDIIC